MYHSNSHMHSHFSHDGDNTMEQMVLASIKKGLKVVTFTEHFDIDSTKADYRNYDYLGYIKEISRLTDLYGDKIEIMRGIELGSPHNFGSILDDVLANHYDFVLGSVHLVDGKSVAHGDCEGIADNMRYYEEMYKLSCVKEIDAIGHFDHIRRGTGLDYYEHSELNAIFSNMIQNKTALEVNTSGIRRIKGEPFPTYEKIAMYLACGGEQLTLGCDSHRIAEVADSYGIVSETLHNLKGAKVGYFKNRKFIETPFIKD